MGKEEIKLLTLTFAIFQSVVKKTKDIHVCINLKKHTISSLEFEGDTEYEYCLIQLLPFIDWKPGYDDDSYVANVNLSINSAHTLKIEPV